MIAGKMIRVGIMIAGKIIRVGIMIGYGTEIRQVRKIIKFNVNGFQNYSTYCLKSKIDPT